MEKLIEENNKLRDQQVRINLIVNSLSEAMDQLVAQLRVVGQEKEALLLENRQLKTKLEEEVED